MDFNTGSTDAHLQNCS